jgi:hypothetical protein
MLRDTTGGRPLNSRLPVFVSADDARSKRGTRMNADQYVVSCASGAEASEENDL